MKTPIGTVLSDNMPYKISNMQIVHIENKIKKDLKGLSDVQKQIKEESEYLAGCMEENMKKYERLVKMDEETSHRYKDTIEEAVDNVNKLLLYTEYIRRKGYVLQKRLKKMDILNENEEMKEMYKKLVKEAERKVLEEAEKRGLLY